MTVVVQPLTRGGAGAVTWCCVGNGKEAESTGGNGPSRLTSTVRSESWVDTWRFSFLVFADFWLKEALLGKRVGSVAVDSTTNFISVDFVSKVPSRHSSAIVVDCGPKCICRLAGVHETESDVPVGKYF